MSARRPCAGLPHSIVEQGTHDELVTKKGFYYTLGTKCVTPVK